MKKIFNYSIVLIIVCFTLQAHAQPVNFSGKWALNEAQSDFQNQQHNVFFKQLNLEQSKTQLKVEGIRETSQEGIPKSSTSTFPLNGTSITVPWAGDRTMTATMNWDSVTRSLIRNATYSQPGKPDVKDYDTNETWTLSGDGKQLSVLRNYSYSNGVKVTLKGIYNKQ